MPTDRSCLMLELAEVGRDDCGQIILLLSFSFISLRKKASNSDLIEMVDFGRETVNGWHRSAVFLKKGFVEFYFVGRMAILSHSYLHHILVFSKSFIFLHVGIDSNQLLRIMCFSSAFQIFY